MNMDFFEHILRIDSTSGREKALSDALVRHFSAGVTGSPRIERFPVGDGTENLLLSWGCPRVVFCTHMDTVPPYIPPHFEDGVVRGRGACDAKGQLFAMYRACLRLAEAGHTGFGLLLLSGEESGSFGAKAFAQTSFRAPYLIVGEPTGNKMASAAKGTAAYSLRFRGKAAHSGYPEYGVSAVKLFFAFLQRLEAVSWGYDSILGDTNWNIGELHSDNPQNILSPELRCRLYFRTTFASHDQVLAWMAGIPEASYEGGDTPREYFTLAGFEQAPVAFGSDAPHLSNFTHRAICGPGSVLVAHRDEEHILVSELEAAVELYVKLYLKLSQS